jgi:hypothetical protein
VNQFENIDGCKSHRAVWSRDGHQLAAVGGCPLMRIVWVVGQSMSRRVSVTFQLQYEVDDDHNYWQHDKNELTHLPSSLAAL